jgi:hypothetical protein
VDKPKVVDAINRVAEYLNTRCLSKTVFDKHRRVLGITIGITTVRKALGSWKEAVEAAGLIPNRSGDSSTSKKPMASEDDLLQEIVRLTQLRGKKTSIDRMNAEGRFSVARHTSADGVRATQHVKPHSRSSATRSRRARHNLAFDRRIP